MPTYVYACPTCGEFETDQRITDEALDKCPTCGAPVERQLSACMFVLKGGGWPTKYYRSKTDEIVKRESAKPDDTPPRVYGPNGAE